MNLKYESDIANAYAGLSRQYTEAGKDYAQLEALYIQLELDHMKLLAHVQTCG